MTHSDALKWIAKTFDESPERLTADTPRSDIASWDSLGVLTLMADLDQDFGIVLADGQAQAMNSTRDILEVLEKHGQLTD